MSAGVKCGLCNGTVYPHEPNLALDGRKFHSKCAKCADCGKYLSLTDFGKASDFIDGDMSVFCKRHYEERFLRSDSKYKGKWERSQIKANDIVVSKRKTAENGYSSEDAEEEEHKPVKRMSLDGLNPLQERTSSTASMRSLQEGMAEVATSDVLDISLIEADISSFADAAADVSTIDVSTASGADLIGLNASPLPEALSPRQSTESTQLLNGSSEAESSALIATASEEAQASPVAAEAEEEGAPTIQQRIRALNRTPSKFVPSPTSLKPADAVDVQYFGSHRLTHSHSSLGENHSSG